MMMIEMCAARLHFSHTPVVREPLPGRLRSATLALLRSAPAAHQEKGDASEGGSRAHESLSHRFRVAKCPIDRSLSRASSLLGDTNLCEFCLTWFSCRFRPPALSNRDNPQRA